MNDEYSFVNHSKFLYDLLCEKLPYSFLKIGYPLFSVYDPCLLPWTSAYGVKDEQDLKQVEQCLTRKNLGILQLISAGKILVKSQHQINHYKSVDELKLNAGLPYFILQCIPIHPTGGKKNVEHQYNITIKRNPYFFTEKS